MRSVSANMSSRLRTLWYKYVVQFVFGSFFRSCFEWVDSTHSRAVRSGSEYIHVLCVT